jgi:hypothetical protein
MSNSATPSKTQTTTLSDHSATQNPDLAIILQFHLTPSALHALSVLYPKAFLPN